MVKISLVPRTYFFPVRSERKKLAWTGDEARLKCSFFSNSHTLCSYRKHDFYDLITRPCNLHVIIILPESCHEWMERMERLRKIRTLKKLRLLLNPIRKVRSGVQEWRKERTLDAIEVGRLP